MGSVNYGHAHSPAEAVRAGRREALWLAVVANGVLVGAEVVGGLVFNSLALLADAAHMFSDVVALSVALVAQRLIERPATARHTYGLQRAEVLGALANSVLLLVVSGWIVYAAIDRLGGDFEVEAGGMTAVATVGLLVNLASAAVLARHAGHSLNMRGAYIHMAYDAAGSAAAVAAGIAIAIADANWFDPVASIAIASLALWSATRLMIDTVHVLLEAAPRGMDALQVERALSSDETVESVHHLHLWNLASDTPALSAHVVLAGEVSLHEAQERGDALKRMLATRFGIEHATLELECHECEPPLPGTE